MLQKIFLSLLAVVFIFNLKSQAQEFAPVGTAVAQFLEIGMGARGTAMGEAYTTLSDDAGAAFWNPAGLVNVKNRNFFLAYNKWPADISVGGVSLAWNLGNVGTVAVSSVFINTGNMVVTTVDDPEGESGQTFAISNYSFGISYSRFLTDRLSVGGTVKMVHEGYMDYGYTSWALDLGTLYRTGFHGLMLGMSILHFGQDIQFSGTYFDYSDPELAKGQQKNFEHYSLPINFRVGLSMDIWQKGIHKIITAADMVHPNNNLEQYNWGIEYGFKQMFFLRAGYKFRADEGGIALGTGVRYSMSNNLSAMIDYSYSDEGVLPAIHRLSVGFSF